MSDNSGIVYVLSNKYMKGLLKIGRTKREDLKKRLKELYNTSVPCEFDCEYACEVDDCKKVEEALHTAFCAQRVNPKREFFNVASESVVAILKLVEKKNLTSMVSKNLGQEVSKEESIAVEKFFKKHRRPPLNFEEMQIPMGAELKTVYSGKEYTAIVCKPRKILFNDEETSLTDATKKIRSIEHDLQPTPFWTYNGKPLSEIYDETYTVSED